MNLLRPFIERIQSKMGADQSTSAPQLKSQRDEDIPYTSYSISKPIDGGADLPRIPKSSPRLPSKGTTSKGATSKEPVGKEAAASSKHKHDIVVVAEGSVEPTTDPEIVKLDNIPIFLPLMRGTLNIPGLQMLKEPEMLDRLDSRSLLQLSLRYQEYLKQCAEAVAFDQNALCVRIKEIDFAISTIYNTLTERQKKFSKYAEQIQKVNEMSTVLNKIKMNVEQTIALMERLNSVLPPDDQLEPFVMKSNK